MLVGFRAVHVFEGLSRDLRPGFGALGGTHDTPQALGDGGETIAQFDYPSAAPRQGVTSRAVQSSYCNGFGLSSRGVPGLIVAEYRPIGGQHRDCFEKRSSFGGAK